MVVLIPATLWLCIGGTFWLLQGLCSHPAQIWPISDFPRVLSNGNLATFDYVTLCGYPQKGRHYVAI